MLLAAPTIERRRGSRGVLVARGGREKRTVHEEPPLATVHEEPPRATVPKPFATVLQPFEPAEDWQLAVAAARASRSCRSMRTAGRGPGRVRDDGPRAGLLFGPAAAGAPAVMYLAPFFPPV